MKKRLPWIIGVVVAAVLLVAVVLPFIYVTVLNDDQPDRLSVDSVTTTTAAGTPASTAATTAPGSAAGIDGTWKIGAGSQAGYRVKEVLFGQDTTAVGRTSKVTGTMDIAGTQIRTATIVVDLTTVESDKDQRDGQFHGRIMQTTRFPNATFNLKQPISLSKVPADGETVTVRAQGDLTLKAKTNPVSIDLSAKRSGATISVSGRIPVRFTDYGISDPSGGPASVGNDGEVEFALAFTR